MKADERMTRDRYITWDFDGTLATRDGGWTGTICEIVAAAVPDHPFDVERLRPFLRRGFPWHAPDVVRDPCTDDEWWAGIDETLQLALTEGVGLDTGTARVLAAEVRHGYLDVRRWIVFEDTVPVLKALSEAGWIHLVLSNHVPELDRLVVDLGLGPWIHRVFNSARLGVEKPNPAAFEHVFAEIPQARTGWMVGDNWVADVCGAENVGLRAVLVRRDHPEATRQCSSLSGVPELVIDRDADPFRAFQRRR